MPDSRATERRAHLRRPIDVPAVVRVGDRELRGRALDISPGGAFLAVPVDDSTQDLIASIELPHGKQIHVVAQVRWRLRAGARPGVGVSFVRFLEEPPARAG